MTVDGTAMQCFFIGASGGTALAFLCAVVAVLWYVAVEIDNTDDY
jgi:hypothetical protein